MTYNFINQTKQRYPKKRIIAFLDHVFLSLGSKVPKSAEELTLVFVTKPKIKSLNKTFRKKDYATDILSFESIEPNNLGELVMSLDVLKKQAREHELTVEEEVCYMVVHGILHLLGYDHEKDDKQARQMYRLQDKIFNSYFRSQ